MLEIMASGYNLDMNFKASMCSWSLLKRGVSPNIGLICIELLIYIYIYIYIYECPYANLAREAAQGWAAARKL
jgi:hypothetical protein